jgi:class 3 adenylate cyclase
LDSFDDVGFITTRSTWYLTRAHTKDAVEAISEFLTGERRQVEVDRLLTTVLFTDIVGSTEQLASLVTRPGTDCSTPMTASCVTSCAITGAGINTTGDGFVASFDGPVRAIRCAQSIVERAQKHGIELRTGLHTGECEVRGENLGGLAVHIAARVGAAARPGEVLVSSTVKDLATGSGIEFQARGEHDLRGVPETWRLYAVASWRIGETARYEGFNEVIGG